MVLLPGDEPVSSGNEGFRLTRKYVPNDEEE